MARHLVVFGLLRFVWFCVTCCGNLLASLPRTGVDAKEPPLNVIELYDGPNGAAYLQIAEFTINGKAEVRACGGMERNR